MTTVNDAPTDLWDEDGDVVWLRADLASDAIRAKRIVYVGRSRDRSVVLPVSQGRECMVPYDCMDVAPEPVCLYERDPDLDYAWMECEKDDPRGVAYWRVTIE